MSIFVSVILARSSEFRLAGTRTVTSLRLDARRADAQPPGVVRKVSAVQVVWVQAAKAQTMVQMHRGTSAVAEICGCCNHSTLDLKAV